MRKGRCGSKRKLRMTPPCKEIKNESVVELERRHTGASTRTQGAVFAKLKTALRASAQAQPGAPNQPDPSPLMTVRANRAAKAVAKALAMVNRFTSAFDECTGGCGGDGCDDCGDGFGRPEHVFKGLYTQLRHKYDSLREEHAAVPVLPDYDAMKAIVSERTIYMTCDGGEFDAVQVTDVDGNTTMFEEADFKSTEEFESAVDHLDEAEEVIDVMRFATGSICIR